jgi:hypothetical protein
MIGMFGVNAFASSSASCLMLRMSTPPDFSLANND